MEKHLTVAYRVFWLAIGFLPVFFFLHRYTGFHKTQQMFERTSTNGNLLRRTLRTDWIDWINRMNHQFKDFVSEKFIYNQKRLILALGAKVFVFET